MRISDWSSDVCSSDLDARPDLRRQARPGRRRSRARAAPGWPLAAVEPGPPRAPQRGRGLRPRQPRLRREGPAQVRRQGRPRRADLGNRDARETAAAFRSDLADREEAVMAPDAGTALKPSPSREGEEQARFGVTR